MCFVSVFSETLTWVSAHTERRGGCRQLASYSKCANIVEMHQTSWVI